MGEPAQAFHVSDFIDDELRARGWSETDLVSRMGYDPEIAFYELVAIRLQSRNVFLELDTAEGLANAFGTSPDLWMRIDAAWQQANLAPAAGDGDGGE